MDQNYIQLLLIKWLKQELHFLYSSISEAEEWFQTSRLTQSYPSAERGSGALPHQALEDMVPLHLLLWGWLAVSVSSASAVCDPWWCWSTDPLSSAS